MDSKYTTTQEKILSAAIQLYGSKGDMTTREIANKAGVNVASINYHFQSKDNLLKAVERHYSNLLYDMQNQILKDPTSSPKDKLTIWANNLMEFMFQCPALIPLVANLVIQDESYNPEIIKKFFDNIEFKEKIEGIISSITHIKDKEILNYKYIQLFSGILGPILFQVMPNISGQKSVFIDFSVEKERKKYIEDLVDTILK
ncbi:Transcriptional regulator, TetR family [[Clostridium] ultunense Esp]|uniref:Transcriptional regulator, TetR family n=1 Tax=[Clostridium] ultunense Esp TaxID=1288971 RepID=M1ZGP5_9FIRM|nr:TetR/AcrR family transcriptional regulator [Schnuerera ultunensis]CCQ92957.1 Transcriptional regulator, TetR family [[Clostridium] ultunense Esp]SHD78433.1 Transcriptional regulator, TetR family [[Clostridium] ultunense Esp]